MFKILPALKDAYITDRVINGIAQTSCNVGAGGSLDLFKLYGATSTISGTVSTPNIEISRLLIQFDLSGLKAAVNAGIVDPNNSTFSCKLHLHDVYGGQPTPRNFTITVYPLSASFDEGLGRDVVYYSDYDTCNWLSGSSSVPWFISGCGLGSTGSNQCDYITTYKSSQTFTTGEEDLDIDVTSIMSATLAGELPDVGLRISFDSSLEGDQYTYFVKRFASRTAFNEDLRPKLIIRFDDSIQDDTDNLYLDSTSYLFLYNYVRSTAANISSVTGPNSLILELKTPVSGGTYSLYFTGSQHTRGNFPVTGIYSASVLIPSNDVTLLSQWQNSGSITFTPIWQSLDRTVAYLTGSTIKAYPPQRGSTSIDPKRFEVTVHGIRESLSSNEHTVLRINVFDYSKSYLTTVSRLPVELPGEIIRDVHYQIRDVATERLVIPFDTITNSTRVSNDSNGMYFKLDTSNLTPGHSYVIDVLIVTGDNQQTYKAASPAFRVGVTA